MKNAFYLLLVAFLLVGCSNPNPLKDQDSGAIATAISAFDEYIAAWEKRLSDGSWEKMLEDGSYIKLVPEADRATDMKAFPAKRIAELKEGRRKMMEELKRRAR